MSNARPRRFALSSDHAAMSLRVALIVVLTGAAVMLAHSQQARREGFLDGADGVNLFYREVGSGPPAVLLHGGPGSNMNGIAPDLEPLAKVRSLVMYDQRGGGRSEIITDVSQLTATHHV